MPRKVVVGHWSQTDVQKRIGGAGDMTDVLVAICDGAFSLLAGATHVTVVLREDEEGTPSYVPIVTRVRGQQGPTTQPIPVTRSVFRKVVSERAAVMLVWDPLCTESKHEMVRLFRLTLMSLALLGWKSLCAAEPITFRLPADNKNENSN